MGSNLNVPQDASTPRWLTIEQGAALAQTSAKTLYRACQCGQLRHARVGGRRGIRLLPAWIDDWMLSHAAPVEVSRG